MVKKKIKKFPIHYDCQGHFRNIYFTIYISLSAYNRILQRGKIIKKFPKSICFNLSNRFELFVVVGIVVYDYSTKWTLKCTNSWIKWESHNKLDDWRFWNIRQSNAIQLATDYPLKPRRISVTDSVPWLTNNRGATVFKTNVRQSIVVITREID